MLTSLQHSLPLSEQPDLQGLFSNAGHRLRLGSHMCSHRSQHGVRCVPVHRFRCDSGPNFCLSSRLHWSQRRTGRFSHPDCGHPRPVLTGSIESRSHSPVMGIGCRETRIQFAYMWTQPKSLPVQRRTIYEQANWSINLGTSWFYMWLLLTAVAASINHCVLPVGTAYPAGRIQ